MVVAFHCFSGSRLFVMVALDTLLYGFVHVGPPDPFLWLGVQFRLGCPTFSLVSVLPSTVSAGGPPLLFDGFAGTTPLYDSPLSCIWVLWLIAFSHRPATFPLQATTGPLGSRTWSFYACLGIYDSAG